MMPALFLAHGSPMLAIEQNSYTEFLKNLGNSIKPKAIVIFTAHWEAEIPNISYSDDVYETIYDFGGFPEELYTIQYPAKGSKEIATKVKDRFEQHGISSKYNMTRGLDHGSWTLLSRMFPEAEIPIVQISVNPYLPIEDQFKIGQSLQGFGAEDVLVIGSGVTVHNLRIVNWGQDTAEAWATKFDDWLIEKVEKRDLDSLFSWKQLAPHASLAVPRAEHFVPLFLAMGSGDPQSSAKVLYRDYEHGTLSYLCFQF